MHVGQEGSQRISVCIAQLVLVCVSVCSLCSKVAAALSSSETWCVDIKSELWLCSLHTPMSLTRAAEY